jgi:hypothetical protein
MIDGMVKQHWESADGWSKTAQIVLTQNKVKEVTGQVHGGSSGGHQTLVLLATWNNVKKWYLQCNTCTASQGLQTGSQSLMHRYNIKAPFESITIDITESFPESQRGTRYLLIAVDWFAK